MSLALSVGGKTKAKEYKSSLGIKDKYQEYFLEHLGNFQTNLQGRAAEKEKLACACFEGLKECEVCVHGRSLPVVYKLVSSQHVTASARAETRRQLPAVYVPYRPLRSCMA